MIKRFRKEIRGRVDIAPFKTVILNSDPQRKANTLAATLLLKEVFDDRITIAYAPDGIVCGSREEAGANRLAAYTQGTTEKEVLLSSVTLSEIETYLEDKTQESHIVFIPDTPEVKLVRRLGDEFPDVLFGL